MSDDLADIVRRHHYGELGVESPRFEMSNAALSEVLTYPRASGTGGSAGAFFGIPIIVEPSLEPDRWRLVDLSGRVWYEGNISENPPETE